jgi:hypothetical protein
MFYAAMRYGKPIQDADEVLAQIGNALRNGTKNVNGPRAFSTSPVSRPRPFLGIGEL